MRCTVILALVLCSGISAHSLEGQATTPGAESTLAAAWSATNVDSATLERMYTESRAIRDGRILVAARQAAELASASPLQRIAALRVLAAYLEPRQGYPLRLVLAPDTIGVRVSRLSPWRPRDGEQPVSEQELAAARATLSRIAATDPDVRVRVSARYLELAIAP